MAENYYDSLIEHIESLLANNDFVNAKKLIDDELAMPFVPRDYLSKLEQYSDFVESNLSSQKTTRIMSPQEVYDSLKAQNEMSFKALETLSMSNIRNYLDVIRDLLTDNQVNHLLKALLIEQLVLQQVNEVIQVVENGTVMNYIPSLLPPVLHQANYKLVDERLEQLIDSNPSFLTQCKLVLTNVAYDRYPKQIENSEIDKIAFSVIRYVFLAYDDLLGLEKFLKLHKIDEIQLEEYSF